MNIHIAAIYLIILVCLKYFYDYHKELSNLLLDLTNEVDRLRNEVKRLKNKED